MLWLKIKYRIQLLFQTILFKIGFSKFLLRNRYDERIIVFHGIDKKGETKYNSRFISEKYFEHFIDFIKKNYNVISLDDFYAKKFKKNTLNIAITFDDGYANNYNYAVPILKKHNVPASFYITTIHNKNDYLWADFIDLVSFYSDKKAIIFNEKEFVKKKNEFYSGNNSLKSELKNVSFDKIQQVYEIFIDDWQKIKQQNFGDYWQLMTEKEIEEIAKHPLFTIGAHGSTHANLAAISTNESKEEFLQSKNELEKICNTQITEFAFPFGYYSDELVEYCREIGYSKILLVDYNNNEDKKNELLKNRFVINPYISFEQQLYFLLRGNY